MAPTPLEKLEGERDATKATIELLEHQITDHATTPMTIHAVNKFISVAERFEQSLPELQTKIAQLKPTDMLIHTNEYQSLMTKVLNSCAKLQEIHASLAPSISTSESSNSTSGENPSSELRLPRFDIPKFSGNLLEWVQFRDIFENVIDKNTKLSDAQKLAHLKGFLTDEPARLIKTMTLTDANYKIAWDQLVRRYHNERELLFAIFRKFLSQSTVTPHSSEGIRKIIDVTTECIHQLQVMSITKDDGLDAMLVYCVSSKLDQATKELWEHTLPNTKIPSLKSLFDFLETRARSLTALTSKPQSKAPLREEQPRRQAHAHFSSEGNSRCKVCKTQSHAIYKCSSFMDKSPKDRSEVVKKLGLCFNCLHHGHPIAKCSSSSRCRTCQGKHHTLIHMQPSHQQFNQETETSSGTESTSTASGSTLSFHTNDNSCSSDKAILATAIIRVRDGNGDYQPCRAFLDAGSTASFITSSCSNRLSLTKRRSNIKVVGLSSTTLGHANGITTVYFKPHFQSTISFCVDTLVLPKVTGKLPLAKCDPSKWSHLNNLCLADLDFGSPAQVDILLGSDIFWDLLLDGRHQGPSNTPVAVKTHLGWLVGGKTGSVKNKVFVHHADLNLENALQRFWEVESVPTKPILTEDERAAEEHFVSTFSRSPSGKFTVKIPWRKDAPSLGDSRSIAIRQFLQLERLLPNTPQYYENYRELMSDYIALGHMELVPDDEITINILELWIIL